MSSASTRNSDHPVSPLILNRWSSRSFTSETISEAQLFTIFEAARWAPSGSNRQPWRLIYALRDSQHWSDFIAPFAEQNKIWASRAAAIVYVASQNKYQRDGETINAVTHAFDAGAAWQNLALQAAADGWNTRAIGGLNRDEARKILQIPEDYTIQAAIALGRRGKLDDLHPSFHEREVPTDRLPLTVIASEGRFRAV